MSIEHFFVRTVAIQHPALVASGYGAATEADFSSATTATVKGWLHQLTELEDQTATRDAEVSTHVLRLPKGTVIGSGDRVVIDGQTFEVNGPPNRAWTPEGEHHVRVPLRYVDG